MKVVNGKIVEITEAELFDLYLKREMDALYSFPYYMRLFERAGTIITDKDQQEDNK